MVYTMLKGLTAVFIISIGIVQCRIKCPENKCPPDSDTCPYPSYYGNSMVGTCRGCNYCVKPGTPEDSTSCPLLPCPSPSPGPNCKNPMFFSRWIIYKNQKCQACHAFVCDPVIVYS